jgi:uncharacterized protein
VTPPVLVVPGWTGSGPAHWQTLWQWAHPRWSRVEQEDWDRPDPSAWTATLRAAVRASPAPPVLVAHSLGSLTVARCAAEGPAPVAGALLVAPADVERSDTPEELRSFAPVPTAPLPFPSIVVASRSDPYLDWQRAVDLAVAWGSRLHDAGMAGHINTEAGFGPWSEGLTLLDELLRGTP